MTWYSHPYRRFTLLGALLYVSMAWLGYQSANNQEIYAECRPSPEKCQAENISKGLPEMTADTVAIIHHFNRANAVRPLPRPIAPIETPDVKAPKVVRRIPPPPPPPPPPPKPRIDCGGWGPVEYKPIFPGCDEGAPYEERQTCGKQKLLEFIYANIRYPANAREWSCSGTAVVEFVVNKDGRVGDAEIVSDPGCSLGKIALAAVMKMNELDIVWKPGLQNGRAVAVKLSLPIRFKLE